MLIAHVAGSALQVEWHKLNEWMPLLNCACSIGLRRDGQEVLNVSLGGARRWIAFRKEINGQECEVVGWQETVGLIRRNGRVVAGSNRKMLAKLYQDGRVRIE